jgi:hypothetical protein
VTFDSLLHMAWRRALASVDEMGFLLVLEPRDSSFFFHRQESIYFSLAATAPARRPSRFEGQPRY